MSRRHHKKVLPPPVVVYIESLSHEGRGIAHVDGKTVFVDGALPGETVLARYRLSKTRYGEAETLEVHQASPDRVTPHCEHFGVCGGCSLQHIHANMQRELKQQTLLEQLRHIAQVQPQQVLPPLCGPLWGYRRRARLGVKYVHKKNTLLVGFREKSAAYLALMERCAVLSPCVGEKIKALRELINGLHAREHIAQIEVAVGDNATALVIRHLVALSDEDCNTLSAFAAHHDFHIYLQSGGMDSVTPLWPAQAQPLYYELPHNDGKIYFQPLDFIQINRAMNLAMLEHALNLLQPQADEHVLELFSGLGNFSLPLARRVAQVTAVEGEASLVARARSNALLNGIHNIEHHSADLSAPIDAPWLHAHYHKLLLDPPRTGALEILRQLPLHGIRRIVYVSCNPATLARDAGELIARGFCMQAAGIMDMFPHTAHVESIALFERKA
jgi:23S rRNA (uracil1939-C5)-methyltransferase